METNDLSPVELRVWQAFAAGVAVDLRTAEDEDTAQGADWGPDRTVRASVLRALLLNGPLEQGEIPALRLGGARITGVLDLSHGAIEHPIRLSDCFFEDVPQLYASRLRHLNLSGSVLPGFAAATMQVDGILHLTGCRFLGQVRLGGTHIAGTVFLDRAEITAPDTAQRALLLSHATIGDDLWAPGLRTRGAVDLNSTSIAGSASLDDARLSHPGSFALDAQTLLVDGDLHMRRTHVRGWIGLRGARITGRLDLSYASLSNPGDAALRASSCTIGELWLRKSPPMEGTLNLRRAQIEVLVLEVEAVPEEVLLNGLVYTDLAPHEPAERRLPMLDRDADGYVPQTYEQLTAAYRRVGDDHAARLVQLAKQRRLRGTRAWYGRLWGYAQDATVGYGFRPLRACAWLVSLLAVGSVAYALHHPRALKTAEAPHFNPVFYTLDLLLPVISFGQEDAFAPDGWYQALSYTLIITGWILATTVITGVTRNVSRQ
ncbi:membrane-associated oxidoreductase [Streptomyces sp. NPDC005706]|uniref:membrane-associated oxidoreductase n=1 Tax=Streptomyces sp. NPDC005706 TaxID=3157169 RepID=UPI0033FA7331